MQSIVLHIPMPDGTDWQKRSHNICHAIGATPAPCRITDRGDGCTMTTGEGGAPFGQISVPLVWYLKHVPESSNGPMPTVLSGGCILWMEQNSPNRPQLAAFGIGWAEWSPAKENED